MITKFKIFEFTNVYVNLTCWCDIEEGKRRQFPLASSLFVHMSLSAQRWNNRNIARWALAPWPFKGATKMWREGCKNQRNKSTNRYKQICRRKQQKKQRSVTNTCKNKCKKQIKSNPLKLQFNHVSFQLIFFFSRKVIFFCPIRPKRWQHYLNCPPIVAFKWNCCPSSIPKD